MNSNGRQRSLALSLSARLLPGALFLGFALSLTPALGMVGGAEPAPPNLARSVVMIIGSYGTACTATAIARELLLTVAHCVLPGADYKYVESPIGPVVKEITAITRHPRFDLKNLFQHRANADVALIKLAAPLPAKFLSAPLIKKTHPIAEGDPFVVVGYGVAVRGRPRSGGILRAARLVAATARNALQIRLFDPRSKGKSAGLGACTGDSGAPAFRDNGGSYTVAGIVSWSTGPGSARGCGGITGVTALAPYRAWILETARRFGSPLD